MNTIIIKSEILLIKHVLTIKSFASGLEIQSNFTRYVKNNFSMIFKTGLLVVWAHKT